MDRAAIAKVRRFNRVVTQRVGALDEHFLRRGRPLGAARLLWEIGDEGSDVRALRARLDLDSGYLSRLLRSLEAAGLATVEPGERDRRVRTARLTRAGLRERAVLDRRGDDLAASFLEPLNGRSVSAWWRRWATSSAC
jgi:DNA-binding MarR family transcriptional regulator